MALPRHPLSPPDQNPLPRQRHGMLFRSALFYASLACLLALAATLDKKVVHVPGFPESPLFSHAVISGGTIYVAGTVGVNMTSVRDGRPTLCAGGIKAETACAFAMIGEVLKAAGPGTTLDNILDCEFAPLSSSCHAVAVLIPPPHELHHASAAPTARPQAQSSSETSRATMRRSMRRTPRSFRRTRRRGRPLEPRGSH